MGGLRMNIGGPSREVKVWLNGVVIGEGDTRDRAVADAVKTLEAAVARLQEPPEAMFEGEG